MPDSTKIIKVIGAKENNLKNISVSIPKNKLVVITGVSGSGKSSLAFDTIFAEGQRRYLESLSTYSRQFLGGNKKPNVDAIEGMSPTIAISQKSTSKNPRSTVGTVTEIYDFLRILFARIGEPFCPNGHGKIKTLTIQQISNQVDTLFKENDKIQILSVYVRKQKGTFTKELDKLRKNGFLRVRIDDKIYSLDEEINLEKNKFHNIDIVIDRIIGHHDNETKSRINDSIETGLKYGNKKIIVVINDQEHIFSETHSCDICGFSIPEMEPRLFSFNSPIGACPVCKGLGVTFEPDENKMVPNPELSITEGGIEYYKNTVGTKNIEWQQFESMLKHYKIPLDKPIKELSRKQLNYIFYGSDEPIKFNITSDSGIKRQGSNYYEGILNHVKRLYFDTKSELLRSFYGKFMVEKKCKACNGKRLSKEALSIKINNKNIIELTDMPINTLLDYFLDLKLTEYQKSIANLIISEIINRLLFLKNVGLDYITLSRSASTLSGGEAQRIRLATQIGSVLTGIIYVLDEPSIGLHQKDNSRLIDALKKMRDLGNTIIVVEHDEETMRAADYLIDIGPEAGENGGKLVGCGSIQDIINCKNSITGQYLSHKKFIPIPKARRSGNGKTITIKGASANNLKNIDVTFPLGKFICVTGVSGSGKSTLVLDTLLANLQKHLFNPFVETGKIKSISGISNVDKLIIVNQDPIGKTPRSNPATYIGVFDEIRELFASTQDARAKGYKKGRFSFNVPGGRCEKCQGDGVIRIDMQFLPAVYVKCDECNGKKYNDETLSVKYKGKSIYDVLQMSVNEAVDFFKNIPSIHHKITLLQDVGLGYLNLGTSSTNLSGGEAQRIKLAKFLQKNSTKDTILVLDEPTTGLHVDDIAKLLNVLNRIVDNGSTLIVIEHNLDFIKCADYIIDLGPDGGNNGGKVIATGSPEQIIKYKDVSYTAKYLYEIFKNN